MSDWLLTHEPQVRPGIFLAVFAILTVAQRVKPRREVPGDWHRKATNLLLVLVDTAILRVAFPLLAFDLAMRFEEAGNSPLHIVPLFWRLHRVHHADTGFDVTTIVRFHPLEIVLSMGIKLGLIALLGVTALAVLVFEMVLSAASLFSHLNIGLPVRLDRRLRWFFVTPDRHRIHHLAHKDETNSNYGFNLSIWDRIFSSYRAMPRDGQTTMQIGLHEFRESCNFSFAAGESRIWTGVSPARARPARPSIKKGPQWGPSSSLTVDLQISTLL